MDKNTLWNTWNSEFLNDDYAQKRIKSAMSKKLTPVLINHDDCFGYFQGSHGRYETFLDRCPCGDFRRAHRPCKHIFRLAMELGLIDYPYESDTLSIPSVRSEQKLLSEAIDDVEKLSEPAQVFLRKTLRSLSSNNPTKKVRSCPELDEIVERGILVSELSGKFAIVSLAASYNLRNISHYLHRKFDDMVYFDPEEGEVSIPLLETNLPDDSVTEQLIQRGYYNRENIKILDSVTLNFVIE